MWSTFALPVIGSHGGPSRGHDHGHGRASVGGCALCMTTPLARTHDEEEIEAAMERVKDRYLEHIAGRVPDGYRGIAVDRDGDNWFLRVYFEEGAEIPSWMPQSLFDVEALSSDRAGWVDTYRVVIERVPPFGALGKASAGGPAKPLSSYCKRPFPPYTWTPEDYDALRDAAGALNTDPEALLRTIWLETDGNPHAVNCWPADAYPNAIGLNQITKVSADAMKISEQERLSLLDMTAAEQLPYVVRSFLAARGGKPFSSPPDAVTLYQTNIAPGTVPNEVIFISPSVNYDANKWLDVDGDGKITRSDLRTALNRVAQRSAYRHAVAELESGVTARGRGKVLVGAALLAGAGYLAYRQGWFNAFLEPSPSRSASHRKEAYG